MLLLLSLDKGACSQGTSSLSDGLIQPISITSTFTILILIDVSHFHSLLVERVWDCLWISLRIPEHSV